MSNWSTLKQAIQNVIKQNDNQEISGDTLQNTLISMVNNLGENATFVDIATPSTNPGTPDGNVFYIASEPGTYANFGGITISDEVALLVWNGTWTKKSTGAALSIALTKKPGKIVEGGEIFNHESNTIHYGGVNNHVEGQGNTCNGSCNHAEGRNTKTFGVGSHSEGDGTIAGGNASHAEGIGTATAVVAGHVEGKYNAVTDSVHIIGGGTSESNRKNLHEIKSDGSQYMIGVGGYDGTNRNNSKSVQESLTELSNKAAGVNYATCETASNTAEKKVSVTGLTSLTIGIRLIIKMTNANSANNATLNINSLGTKPLYYDNTRATNDNSWESGEVIDVYYDGTNFYSSNAQGGSGESGNLILEWNTDVATTRKQVPLKDRKELLIISYKNADGNAVNEQYIGKDLDDNSWASNNNWENIPNGKEFSNIADKVSDIDFQLFGSSKVIVDISEEVHGGLYRVVDNINVKAGLETTVSVQFNISSGNPYWGLKMSSPVVQDILNSEYGSRDYIFTPENDSILYVWIGGGSSEPKGTIKVKVTQPSPKYIETIKENKDKIDSLDVMVRGLPDEYVLNETYTIGSSSAHRVVDNISLKANEEYEITCEGDIFSTTNIGYMIGIKMREPELKDLFLDSAVYNKTVRYKPNIDCTIYIWVNLAVVGSNLSIKIIKKAKQSLEEKINGSIEVSLDKVDGVEDCSLENLFDPTTTLAYDSPFADKVYSAIGRKTDTTGCYSAPISCKEGDYFTRTGLGTGIVVVMDHIGNILGDIKNAAYNSTIHIKASEGQDFSSAASVSFVVMVSEKNDVKIVKAKYVPAYKGDFLVIPKLQIKQENMSPDVITYIQGTSGKKYQLQIDDSGETPTLKFTALEGIPSSQLPSDFPKLKITGDFSDYYDYIILSMRNAGTPYIAQINSRGEVVRYLQKEINCFKTIVEDGKRYYYGATGSPNISSGELLIYEEYGETFKQVGDAVRFTTGEVIEPHDTLVISVSEKHYILQRYVPNTTTIVNGEEKIVKALHVEEQYNGKQIWIWKSEDYPELWNDSNYQNNNDDYLHNNTICLDKDGNLCLNNKQANQILIVKRTWDNEEHTGSIGSILWKIGGNSSKSTYDVPTRIKTTTIQQWYESHSAFVNSNGLWTMFDNRSNSPSRIIEFEVNYETKNLKEGTFKAYTMKSYFGRYMGSADKLGDGIYLVSWGSTKSSGTPMLGLYDFTNSKTIFELDSDNIGRSVYRVYGFKK